MNGAETNNNRMDGASYDALGNLMVNPSGGGSYVYDAESRLISAGGLKYLYDAEGRRVAKLSAATVTNEYLFDTDGNQQIELNGSGTVLHTNLWAGGSFWRLIKEPTPTSTLLTGSAPVATKPAPQAECESCT